MIDFHDITVRDQRWIEPILHAANKPGADYTFTSMLFWTNYYGQVGRVGDFVTQYLHWEGRNIYLFPAGQGDLRVAVDAVLDDSLRRGGPGISGGSVSGPLPVHAVPRFVRLYLHRRRADRAARQKAAIQAQPLPPLRIGAPGLAYRGHHGGEH